MVEKTGLDTELQQMMVDTVKRFAKERLLPLEKQVDLTDSIPEEIIEEMKSLGLFGLSIPQTYGGLGLSMSDEVQVIKAMGYVSPAFRSVFGTNVGIGSQAIVIDGTAEQKAHYLPKLASGELIGSFALTEPNVGSDAAAVQMKATRVEKGYVLNGTKRYITNANRAGLFTVIARTGSKSSRAKGLTAFLVDADTAGISLGPKDRKMGQRGAITCDVLFENVWVDEKNIIGGKAGEGFKTAMKVLDRGRLHISALSVGISQRLIDLAVDYANTREQFGQKIAGFQLIQAMLADSYTETFAANSMVEAAARDFDHHCLASIDASACKLFCTESVGKIADRAVQIFGGAGYMQEYDVERIFRDVRLLRLYEGTSQIQQIIIAKKLTSAKY